MSPKELVAEVAPAPKRAPVRPDTVEVRPRWESVPAQAVSEASPGPADRRVLLPFCVTVFTSAFLLFQVQPVIGKCILPWFGSSPGVWATCMLFFQLLLLGGYAYAHLLVSRFRPRHQALIHCSLLLVALLLLPITPDASWKPTDASAPIGRILGVLAASVGIPYLLLSASGPMLQGWFSRLPPGRSPYRLYALSNVGSLLALLSYPFVFERLLALHDQTVLWSIGYALFALLCGNCAWLLARRAPVETSRAAPVPVAEAVAAERPRASRVGLWLVLSACGSGLLLATTNQMCLDVAVVPFLWVLPLCLYLLSFIFTFDSDRWYSRTLFFALLPVAMLNVVRLLFEGVHLGLVDQIVGYSAALFVCCMCCHGELARLKPAPRHLTFFFLVVSIGGAIGGILVAVVAPVVFRGFYEFPLLLVACAALMAWIALRAPVPSAGSLTQRGFRTTCALLGLGAIVFGSWLALQPDTWVEGASSRTVALFETWQGQMFTSLAVSLAAVLLGAEVLRRRTGVAAGQWWGSRRSLLRLGSRSVILLGLVILGGVFLWVAREDERRHVLRDRNFYGMLAIREYGAGTKHHTWGLKHGRVRHGVQLKRHPDWPTSYYGPRSGIGFALRMHPSRGVTTRAFRVGVIGLGAGTMACYANAKIDPERSRRNYVHAAAPAHPDYMRFYELNPMVSDWAEEHFSFLRDARARGADVETWLGDARIVLERQLEAGEAQGFDVLAVDAFSSDAIPIHLLTREALETYWRHLRPDGILALHVSNRFLDMKPVVRRLADELGHELIYSKNDERESRAVGGASWMLMTSNRAFLDQEAVRVFERDLPEPGPLWTDDFSSLSELIKAAE